MINSPDYVTALREKLKVRKLELANVQTLRNEAEKKTGHIRFAAEKLKTEAGRVINGECDNRSKKTIGQQLIDQIATVAAFEASVLDYQEKEKHLGAEISEIKTELAGAKNRFRQEQELANVKEFGDLVAEFVARARPIIADARGLRSDHVLHSVNEAVIPIGGRNALRSLRYAPEDPAMRQIAEEWGNFFVAIDQEVSQN